MSGPGYNSSLMIILLSNIFIAGLSYYLSYVYVFVNRFMHSFFVTRITQRLRYRVLMLFQAVLLGFGLLIMSYGRRAVWQNLLIWLHHYPYIGVFVFAAAVLVLISPLVTLITACYIYLHPVSRAAKYRLIGRHFIGAQAFPYSPPRLTTPEISVLDEQPSPPRYYYVRGEGKEADKEAVA